MKKLIIIVIILVIAGLLYFWKSSSNTTSVEFGYNPNSIDRHPDPSNATFIFDDGPVTLSAGRNERTITPGSALSEETTLMDKFAYGDINKDGRGDTALLLARYGGGSGTFIYLAAFVSGPFNYKGSEVIFLGDRISPQSISIDGDIVTIKYLDREPDEAFSAEPTVPMSKQFIYKNGGFQEK